MVMVLDTTEHDTRDCPFEAIGLYDAPSISIAERWLVEINQKLTERGCCEVGNAGRAATRRVQVERNLNLIHHSDTHP